MTPRSRKPVLLVSGTNITALPKSETSNSVVNNIIEKSFVSRGKQLLESKNFIKSRSETDLLDLKTNKIEKLNKSDSPVETSLSDVFKAYLSHRNMITFSSPIDASFSSRAEDFSSCNFQNLDDNPISTSLLHCLEGNHPDDVIMFSLPNKQEANEREWVLKPKQVDEDGKIIFETSF